MDPILMELKETFPGRSNQIDQLYNLFGYKDQPFIDCIYICGGPSVGKSTVTTTTLHKLDINHIVINLIECYTSKILFEMILNKLSRHKIDPTKGQPYAKCDNMMDFIFHLRKIHENLINLNRTVIILDKAEQLRSMDFNLLSGFLRFQELTGISISVIFLSEIIFEKYYCKLNVIEPLKIYFPQYNKDELLEILSLDVDIVRRMLIKHFNCQVGCDFDLNFFRNYLNVFLSVFYRACRDLSELRHMSRINFLKYYRPIVNGECSVNDSMALWRHIAPILKNSLEGLYLRISCEQNVKDSLELPFYAKYLLIAAYLASYNSVKDDKRLFMKYHGKKTKTNRDVKIKSKVSEQLNTQLGPKPFTFDRLLAIFYAILDDKVGFNNNLLAQISSLVELQLLSTLSDNCSLDGQKYKCNVNYDFIHNVSKTVGFNIRKYLSDFSHM